MTENTTPVSGGHNIDSHKTQWHMAAVCGEGKPEIV